VFPCIPLPTLTFSKEGSIIRKHIQQTEEFHFACDADEIFLPLISPARQQNSSHKHLAAESFPSLAISREFPRRAKEARANALLLRIPLWPGHFFFLYIQRAGVLCGVVFENIITEKGLVVHSALGRQDLWRAGTKWSNTKSFCNAGVAASEYTLLSAHGVMPGPEMRLAPDLTSPRAHYRAIMKTLYYLGMRVSRSLGSRHDFWPLAPHGGDDLFGEPYKHTRLVLS
jgi:hypothetical protein